MDDNRTGVSDTSEGGWREAHVAWCTKQGIPESVRWKTQDAFHAGFLAAQPPAPGAQIAERLRQIARENFGAAGQNWERNALEQAATALSGAPTASPSDAGLAEAVARVIDSEAWELAYGEVGAAHDDMIENRRVASLVKASTIIALVEARWAGEREALVEGLRAANGTLVYILNVGARLPFSAPELNEFEGALRKVEQALALVRDKTW
jgi:hypothetical protein